ncbi:MAG: TIGR03086 family metal-binding protein [Actinomycetota bacterium]|nr:TIGR03086 family metal-binding protein [Actinomycetota bacterium]
MSDIADRYQRLADAFERKIAAVGSEQWSQQSPCEAWTARGVVDHVVEVHGMMLGQIDRRLSEPPVTDDPMAAFRSARADVEKVLGDPELAGTEYDGAFGRTNIAATIDQFLGFDLVVHGWDLGRATGQDDTIDPSEVDRVWAFAQQLGDNLRRPQVCGPAVEVPGDASVQDRLLALLGRNPS